MGNHGDEDIPYAVERNVPSHSVGHGQILLADADGSSHASCNLVVERWKESRLLLESASSLSPGCCHAFFNVRLACTSSSSPRMSCSYASTTCKAARPTRSPGCCHAFFNARLAYTSSSRPRWSCSYASTTCKAARSRRSRPSAATIDNSAVSSRRSRPSAAISWAGQHNTASSTSANNFRG